MDFVVLLAPVLAATVSAFLTARQAGAERSRLTASLAGAETRIARLNELLMAVKAPEAYAAYLDQSPAAPTPQYRFSDDGLIAFLPDPDDDA